MTCAPQFNGIARTNQPHPRPLPHVGEGANDALCAAQTLAETNPLFVQYGNFISSDFMLGRLNLDPAQTQKRLGDAFYEQKLVSDQITSLTGRKFLPGYTSAEAEFIALMEQGLSEARAQNLIPGVALTRAQIAALTHDIVWMVSREVTLPNGTPKRKKPG